MIGAIDLPEARKTQPVPENFGAVPADGIDLDRLLADVERGWVLRALEHTGGVRKRAATALGISFRSLCYRLAKLEFDKGDEPVDELE